METIVSSELGRNSPPHTRVWRSTLVRSSVPHWGAEEQEVLGQVLDAYQEKLLATSRALRTLETNGISADAIAEFRLGFSDRSVGKVLPSGETYEGAMLRGRLQSIGLFRLSGHAHFNGALVAPVTGFNDRVVDIYGRKICPKLRAGSAYHLSLFDPPQGVFNLAGIARSKEVVLCGDLMDALAFWSAGIRAVTTTVGSRGFTDAHLRAFKAFGVKRVVIAMPTGKADDRIARLIAQALDYMEIECAKVNLAQEVGNPSLLPELVRSAPAFRQSADAMFGVVAQ